MRALYPGLSIDERSYVGPNCDIVVVDGSSIDLVGTHISAGSVLRANHGGRLRIEDSYVGFDSVIVTCDQITIERGCQIAEMVVIRDHDHDFGAGKTLAESGHRTAPITIGRNVWIGAKATILRGVQIGDNAVVAGSAVVRDSIEAGTLHAGIPARFVKKL